MPKRLFERCMECNVLLHTHRNKTKGGGSPSFVCSECNNRANAAMSNYKAWLEQRQTESNKYKDDETKDI